MKRTRSAAVATTAVLVGLAGAGLAGHALAASGAKVITACQTATSVRSITAGSRPGKCPAGQRRTVWNGAGPQGPEGGSGPRGAPAVSTLPSQTVIGNWDPTVKKVIPQPVLIAFDGTHFWVIDLQGRVAEVTESGAVLRVVHDSGSPADVAYDGSHVWISNHDANSLTEINPATGAIIRTVSGASYHLDAPEGMAVTPGGHLWIANDVGPSGSPHGSVTEINTSDGSLVRVIGNASDGFNDPSRVLYDGAHLWITNYHGKSVTELNASDGSLVRVLSGGSYGFNLPLDITFDGSHLWVTNYGAFSVTEFNASNGSWVQTLGPSDGFDFPVGILAIGTEVYVANAGSDDVIALDAATGDVHAVLNQGYYGFSGPYWLAYDGFSLWVLNAKAGTVTIVPLSP